MSKSVLISIRPKWCEKIINGEKRIELRKNYPNVKSPFTCYIYCTKPREFVRHRRLVEPMDDLYRLPNGEIKCGYSGELMLCKESYDQSNFLNGKVIGEFQCDAIFCAVRYNENDSEHPLFHPQTVKDSCLSKEDVLQYSGGKRVYGWRISELKIYEKPKPLSEFSLFDLADKSTKIQLKHAPQSWCYVGDN